MAVELKMKNKMRFKKNKPIPKPSQATPGTNLEVLSHFNNFKP
jgi:hypothetical protein